MKRIFIALSLLLLTVALSEADGPEDRRLEVTVKTDKDRINIGDRFKLNAVVESPGGYDLLFPEVPEKLGEFSCAGSTAIKTGWPKARTVGREYIMSIYTTGPHVVPPIQVMYKKSGTDEWLLAQSPQVPVEIDSLLTGEYTDIRDLKGIVFPGYGLARRAILPALALVAAAVLWILWRKRREQIAAENAKPRSPHEIAYERLRQLKDEDLPGQGRVKEYYSALSDVIRHYLENRFSYRAPEMTTEEFMEAIKVSSEMLDGHKDLLKDFLSHCDMVKFAKYGPTPLEVLDSFSAAERLVDQTKTGDEEGEK